MQRPIALVAIAATLLAGCAEPRDDRADGDAGDEPLPDDYTPTNPPPNQGFAPQSGSGNATRDGIRLDVTWRECPAGFCANATARNEGSKTVRVSSICVAPWEDRVSRDGKEVKHRPDQAVCLAYGRAPFAPGAVAYGNFTWDGRVYEGSEPQGAGEPAPAGLYTWTIVFWWEEHEGGPRGEVEAELQVLVGVPT